MTLKKRVKDVCIIASLLTAILSECVLIKSFIKQKEEIVNLQNNIKQLEQKIEESNNTNTDLQQENEDLNKQLEEKIKDNTDLKKENEILNENIKLKEKQIQEQQESISLFNTETEQNENIRTANYSIEKCNSNTTTGTAIKMELTFYGETGNKTASGVYPTAGTLASNVYPIGTEFIINGQKFKVEDRGGHEFNNYNRLDVFVPRREGESLKDYNDRIKEYGRRTITVYKVS